MHRIALAIAVMACALVFGDQAWAIDPSQTPARGPNTEQTSSPSGDNAPPQRAAGTPAVAGYWLISVGNDGNTALFADQTLVTRPAAGIRRMWDTIVYRTGNHFENGLPVESVVTLSEYDCRNRTIRWLQLNNYGVGGGVINSGNNDRYAAQFVAPGTVGETRLEHACSDFSDWGGRLGSTLLPSGIEPVDYADTVLFASSPNPAVLIGRWGLNGSCAHALILAADGTFVTSGFDTDTSGRWSQSGNTLHLNQVSGTVDAQIDWSDPNTLRLTMSDSSVLVESRC